MAGGNFYRALGNQILALWESNRRPWLNVTQLLAEDVFTIIILKVFRIFICFKSHLGTKKKYNRVPQVVHLCRVRQSCRSVWVKITSKKKQKCLFLPLAIGRELRRFWFGNNKASRVDSDSALCSRSPFAWSWQHDSASWLISDQGHLFLNVTRGHALARNTYREQIYLRIWLFSGHPPKRLYHPFIDDSSANIFFGTPSTSDNLNNCKTRTALLRRVPKYTLGNF